MKSPPVTPLNRPLRMACLISGGGTTVLNFCRQIQEDSLSAEIPLVIASRRECSGIERMQEAGLRCDVIRPKDYETIEAYSAAVFDLCREANVDLVALAGFLSLIQIPEDFQYRVMNIHPALIPAFCGKGYFGHHVHEAVIRRGVKVSGCTVHFSDNQYDHGPIILQRTVPVFDADTADTVAARVFEQECLAYPEAIRLFAEGKLLVRDQRVCIREE